MRKYRICKNKYNVKYKIQYWAPDRKVFFIKVKGRWKDRLLHQRGGWHICGYYDTSEEAQQIINQLIKNHKWRNEEWSSLRIQTSK